MKTSGAFRENTTASEESHQKTKAEGCQLSSQYVQAYNIPIVELHNFTIKPLTFSLDVTLLRGQCNTCLLHKIIIACLNFVWNFHDLGDPGDPGDPGYLAVWLLHMPCFHC